MTVAVNPLPTATISGTIDVCEGDVNPDITFTGSGGTAPYTFTYTINGGSNQTVVSTGNSATVSVPTGTSGTFEYELVAVEDGSSTTCSSAASGIATVTVNPLPSATISATITEVCEGGTPPVITFTGSGGTAPYTFTYTINGGSNQTVVSTGSTATVNAPTGTTGSFTYQLVSVEDGSSTTCTNSASGSVTIEVNPNPTGTMTASSTVVCQGGTQPTITFVGSGGIKPYTFHYNINGGTPQTAVTSGSSSVVVINVPTTTSGTFTYELTSVEDNSSTNCSTSTSDIITITVNPLPTASISGNATVCQNATAPLITFSGANGTSPYTFYYTIDDGSNTTSHSVTTSSGSSVTVNAPTTTPGTFIYELVSVEDAGSLSCSNTASGSVTVVVNPSPSATISGTIDVCAGDPNPDITFTGSNGTAPYIFTYNINGGSSQTVTSTGNSATVSVPTGTPGTYTYNLVAVEDGSSTTCSNNASGSATVQVNPLPTASISGTAVVCENGASPIITFTGGNGTAPYTFTYSVNGGANQTVTSSGSTATIGVPTGVPGTFTYELVSVTDGSSTACSSTVSGTATITVEPLPSATISGTVTVCEGDPNPNITFIGSGGTAPYTFTYTLNGGGTQTITSGGSTVNISVPTNSSGTYTYQLVSVQDASSATCSNSSSGTAVVTVNPLPTATISGTIEVCQNSTNPDITFTGSNGTAPYTFTYTVNGGSPQTVTSTGNSATVSVPTGTTGTFVYNLESVEDASATTCSANATGSATVTVNSLPLATVAAGATEVCLGGTSPQVIFTGSNGTPNYTFTYSINGGPNQTVTSTGNSAIVSVPTGTAGTFQYELVAVEDASSATCSNLVGTSVTVTVNPLPDATFTGLGTDLCIDDGLITLTPAQSGGSFTGTGVTGNTFDPGATGSGTYTVTYAITDGNGCYAETSQNVTVHALPNATFSGLGTDKCVDAASSVLTPIQTGGTFSGPGITGNTFDPNTAGVGIHTITYSITDGNGCYAETSQNIEVFPLPDATFNTLASDYCIDAPSVPLTANQSGGTFTVDGTPNTVFDPGAVGVGTHTIEYSITDGNGCSAVETQIVDVNPLPNSTFTGLLSGYCISSSSVQLTPGQSGGTFTGPGIVSGNNFNPAVAGVGTHTITYSITSGAGCFSTSSQQVEVYPLPISTFNGLSNTYCLNDSPVTLTPDQSGGTFYGNGMTGSTFDPNNAGVGLHTISYSIVDTNSCSSTSTQNVTVYDVPDATFTGLPNPAVRCINADSIELIPVDPNGSFSGAGISGNFFYPSIAGIGVHTITYTATNGVGCSFDSQQDIEVIPAPDAGFTGLSSVYCSSDNFTVPLTPNFSGGTFSGPGVDPFNNTWTPEDANLGQNTIVYEVSFAGCTSTSSKVVNVLLSPNADFTNLDDVYCTNEDPVTLVPVNPGGQFTSTSGVVNSTFYPQIATVGLNVITYTVSFGNGCANTSSDTLEVKQAPNVGSPTIENDFTLVAPNLGPGTTYQWIDCNDNTPIPGETNQKFTTYQNGYYGVVVYNDEGCSDTSSCVLIHHTGLETYLDEKLNVYPNPNNGKFNIDTPADVKVDIVNSIGQVVYQGEFNKGHGSIDLRDFIETGMYIIRFTDENGDSAYRNIVIRN